VWMSSLVWREDSRGISGSRWGWSCCWREGLVMITRRRKLWPKGRSYANENMSRWRRLGYCFSRWCWGCGGCKHDGERGKSNNGRRKTRGSLIKNRAKTEKTEPNRFEPVSVFFIKKISVCTEQKMITPTCIHPCKQLWFKTMLENKNQRVNL
jgi:hypothetical protein